MVNIRVPQKSKITFQPSFLMFHPENCILEDNGFWVNISNTVIFSETFPLTSKTDIVTMRRAGSSKG